MKREIKFRAWDERGKIMHHDFQFFTSGNEGNDWICFSSDKEPRDTETVKSGIVFKNPYFRQQLKIMQFTGLLDKAGHEIYEGDILEPFPGSGSAETRKNVRQVVWSDGGFNLRQMNGKSTFFLIGKSEAESMEIIGNIYENSELLK